MARFVPSRLGALDIMLKGTQKNDSFVVYLMSYSLLQALQTVPTATA
jgi:hypothetical protein